MTHRSRTKYLLVGVFAVLLNSCDQRTEEPDPVAALAESFGLRELELLGRIRSAKTPEDRERLIVELEATTVKVHPYYSRWLVLHEIHPLYCWSDEGYDPGQSDVPRDIQLLVATHVGVADIANGGFRQFFCNGTGAFAPEMVEWFERADMPEAAQIMTQAMAKFGESFPRSQAARQKIYAGYVGDNLEANPFYELEPRFDAAISGSALHSTFHLAADAWLRETCGMTNLRMKYTAAADSNAEQK